MSRSSFEVNFAFVDAGNQLDSISSIIDYYDRFTATFRVEKGVMKKSIYGISLDNKTIDYFAIGKKSGRVATFTDRVTFTNFFSVGFSLEQFLNVFPDLRERLNERAGGIIDISPKASQRVFSWLVDEYPGFSNWMESAFETDFDNSTLTAEHEQGDAILSALDWAGFDLEQKNVSARLSGNLPRFLHDLTHITMSEDEIIYNDFSVFSDWTRSEITGAAYFKKNDEELYIWNVNRRPLETVLGVDLIYFVQKYNSFVMVQYKRMKKEGDKWVYRPTDKSYHHELERIRTFLSLHQETSVPAEPNDYRLNYNPFFFKLCKSELNVHSSKGLISGMYIPLDYWQQLINHPNIAKGQNGGQAIGFHNALRWLSKTEFANLLQNGWLGTDRTMYTDLSRLIESALNGDRAVTIAAKISGGVAQQCLTES